MSLQGILKKSCSDIIVGQVGSSKLTSLIEPGDKLKHWISKIKTKESSASRLLNQTSRFGTQMHQELLVPASHDRTEAKAESTCQSLEC